MDTTIHPPNLPILLAPLLSSLPTCTISPTPPPALLSLLSPILRQRVQILSSTSTSNNREPWLPLLSRDHNATTLPNLITSHSANLEPHPVSGEIELDWDASAHLGYRRIDVETFCCIITIAELGLCIELVWCTGDDVLPGEDGWKISSLDALDLETSWSEEVYASIAAAEANFQVTSRCCLSASRAAQSDKPTGDGEGSTDGSVFKDEDDDDYWAQYDGTPGPTPAPHRSSDLLSTTARKTDEDEEHAGEEYYNSYTEVQPALDGHDPDEVISLDAAGLRPGSMVRPINTDVTQHTPDVTPPSQTWEKIDAQSSFSGASERELDKPQAMHRSSDRDGSEAVAMLERKARMQESLNAEAQCAMGVKRHIEHTVKNLYLLAKGTGIEGNDFVEIVERELECLGIFDEAE